MEFSQKIEFLEDEITELNGILKKKESDVA